MSRRRRIAAILALAALVALCVAAVVPTPYLIVAPGTAVNLGERVAVAGHPPPSDRYYLTDVLVLRATVLELAARVIPGVRIVPVRELVPAGVSGARYDRVLDQAMVESQINAAVVAERAAGLHVPSPPAQIAIAQTIAGVPSARVLRGGDVVRSVDGTAIRSRTDIERALATGRPGVPATVVVTRDGRIARLSVPTVRLHGATRLGVLVEVREAMPRLPVPVRFKVDGISGSSAGLMFALEIYGALHPRGAPPALVVAGTGTLAGDGTVGEIEGALQKLIAARRVGARIFFVPVKNYADVAGAHGIRIVPIKTFDQALAALRGSAGA
ncbi:MAG: PDZ domain-containing protein [Vulcanimicrobiaceae bacterium]